MTEVKAAKPDRFQFDLRALLCGTVVISLAMAYLRSLDPVYLIPGSIAATGALVIGTVVGIFSGRIADSAYWAVLGATFAFISAVEVVSYYGAWAWTGAITGAAIGCVGSGRPLHRMIVGALAATVSFGSYVLSFHAGAPNEIWWDLLGVPVIGAMFGLLVEIFFLIEARSSLPRYVTATVLMLAVCLGNYLSR